MSIADHPVRPLVLRALARPRTVALACIAMLVTAGWTYLGLVLAGQYSEGVLAALCAPIYGLTGLLGGAGFVLMFAMWCAMVLAMMLPTAAPMIITYADLAETAAAKGELAASPLVLLEGYVSIWLGAAVVLTTAQGLLAHAKALDDLMSVADPMLAGGLFFLAGAYQFTALKHACLTRCQNPFRFFFANWTADARGVFRIGLRQGLYCLGCCWAMMLLMFAVGIMSTLWMAVLGVVMAIEKIGTTRHFSHAVGVLWLVIGLGIIAQYIMR